jgi:hypothetical protein
MVIVALAGLLAGVLTQNVQAAALNEAMVIQRLAVGLSRYADKHRDPLAMLMAAKLQKSIGTRSSVKPQPPSSPASAEDSAEMDVSTTGLLARARQYANGQHDLLALADDIEAMSSRGTEIGPIRGRTVVRAHKDWHNVDYAYVPGQRAVFEIQGDGSSDLAIEVLDAANNSICATDHAGDAKTCAWTPATEVSYRVKVRNLGEKLNLFDYYQN